MKQRFERLLKKIWISFHERKWQGRLKYVYENNHSDKLIVVFSAFAPKPSYNYMRTLRGLKSMDKLFILDDFGVRGSYYWYEGGSNYPMHLVMSLIEDKLRRGGYADLYTLGTSKGGSCAIYFGLLFNARHIYSGACQYYIGNYLNKEGRESILAAMMGEGYTMSDVQLLNQMLPEAIRTHKGCDSIIHLLYSKNEHTYKEHIAFLIKDLNNNNMQFTERIEDFMNHDDVGKFFIPFIKTELHVE